MLTSSPQYNAAFANMLGAWETKAEKAKRVERQEIYGPDEVIENILVSGSAEVESNITSELTTITKHSIIEEIAQEPDFDEKLIALVLSGDSDAAFKLADEAFSKEAQRRINEAVKAA